MCACHGVPKLKDGRCRIKARERQHRFRELNAENAVERHRRYWHKADGGYIRRRKRDLAGQREQIQSRLGQLQEELMHLDT